MPPPFFTRFTNVTIDTADGMTHLAKPPDEAGEDTRFVYLSEETQNGFILHIGTLCTCGEGACTTRISDSQYCTSANIGMDAVLQLHFARDGSDLINDPAARNFSVVTQVDLTEQLAAKGDVETETETVTETVTDTETVTETETEEPEQGGENFENISASTSVSVEIPDIFRFSVTPPDGQSGDGATGTISINESHLALRSDKPFVLTVDTDGLLYLAGSLRMTAKNADGTHRSLTAGDDYVFSFDAENHTIKIEIPDPQSSSFDIDFSLVSQTDTTEETDHEIVASCELFEKEIVCTDSVTMPASLSDGQTPHEYSVSVVLTEDHSGTNAPISGALFGLFAGNGDLVVSAYTDDDGKAYLSHRMINPHSLYYIKQISSVSGYRADKTAHYIVFCDTSQENCDVCFGMIGGAVSSHRIAQNETLSIDMVNQYLGTYRLPATGGGGTSGYYNAGISLILLSALLGFVRRRQRKREGGP